LLGTRNTEAPQSLRVLTRAAVSLVTCRAADILRPSRGFFSLYIDLSFMTTGMWASAHSTFSLPSLAKEGSLTFELDKASHRGRGGKGH